LCIRLAYYDCIELDRTRRKSECRLRRWLLGAYACTPNGEQGNQDQTSSAIEAASGRRNWTRREHSAKDPLRTVNKPKYPFKDNARNLSGGQ